MDTVTGTLQGTIEFDGHKPTQAFLRQCTGADSSLHIHAPHVYCCFAKSTSDLRHGPSVTAVRLTNSWHPLGDAVLSGRPSNPILILTAFLFARCRLRGAD